PVTSYMQGEYVIASAEERIRIGHVPGVATVAGEIQVGAGPERISDRRKIRDAIPQNSSHARQLGGLLLELGVSIGQSDTGQQREEEGPAKETRREHGGPATTAQVRSEARRHSTTSISWVRVSLSSPARSMAWKTSVVVPGWFVEAISTTRV